MPQGAGTVCEAFVPCIDACGAGAQRMWHERGPLHPSMQIRMTKGRWPSDRCARAHDTCCCFVTDWQRTERSHHSRLDTTRRHPSHWQARMRRVGCCRPRERWMGAPSRWQGAHEGMASSPLDMRSSRSKTAGSSRRPECWNSLVTHRLGWPPRSAAVCSEKALST